MKVRKNSAKKLSFRPYALFIYFEESVPTILFWKDEQNWTQTFPAIYRCLNFPTNRTSFSTKLPLIGLKVRKRFETKAQTLWPAMLLKDWDIRRDLMRILVWRRKAALKSVTAHSSSSTESWVFPTQWRTAKTAVRTEVSLHCPTGSNLFREMKQGMGNLSQLGQQLQYCAASSGQSNSVWYGKLCSNTRKNDWIRYFCFFSSGFLLHLKPVLPTSRQKDSAKSKS